MFDFSRMKSAFGRRASREERDIEDVSFEEIRKDSTNDDAANEARRRARADAVRSEALSFLERVTEKITPGYIEGLAIMSLFIAGAKWCDGLPASVVESESVFLGRLSSAVDSHLRDGNAAPSVKAYLFLGLCFSTGATWAREHPETPPV